MNEQDISVTPSTPPVLPADNFSAPLSNRKKIYIVAGLIGLVVLSGGILYFNRDGKFSIKTEYPQIYTLVNDKISASAPIQINLPDGVLKTGIEQNITFSPVLKGEWASTGLASVVAFKPEKKLEAGKYYTVALTTADGEIKKDFQADEDPAIIDIFPKANSEADESSVITIVFNRPMVPLTTLSELEKNDISVTITPETEGKFKWISPRNLQFIPKTTLIRSAHYEVKVNSGFVSMDGLSVKGLTHEFTTRPLRFEYSTNGTIRYNQSIEFRFNQPVDLVRTTQEISLTNVTTGSKVPFKTEYGSSLIYDSKTGENIKLEDRSVVSILPEKDKLGRAGLWDFENNYSAVILKAYPVGGDIVNPVNAQSRVTITGIIQSVTAESARTDLASQKLFDPEGKVTISFFEDIDLKKSDISVKGLEKVGYGKKCKAENNNRNYYNASCEMIDDQTTLIFSFDATKLKVPGESVPIRLERIVNTEGLTLDTKEIIVPLSVYPALKILRISPASGATDGSIRDLTICTNSPLEALSGEAFYEAIKANNYLVLGRWNRAYLQTLNAYDKKPPCLEGEYVNIVRYGLLPEMPYTLDLTLSDVFGQTIQRKLSFKTEKAPNFYLRFHALDKIYNVTTPGKTKLTYAVENFDFVNVHVCKVDPLTMVRYLANRPANTISGGSLSCIDTAADTIAIPPKLWINNYFQIDLTDYFADTRGQYVISFTNPRYTNSQGAQLFERTYMSVTNLAVVEKKVNWTKYDVLPKVTKETVDAADPKGELYWVSRIGTLAPEAGAVVSVVKDPGFSGAVPVVAEIGATNSSGIATFPLIQDVVGATVRSGVDTAIVSSWTDTLNWSSGAYSGNRIYLYTDRPIYRPGQEVFIKGIYRLDFDGAYKIDMDFPVEVKVTDSRGNVIYTKNAVVSKYGTFNASLKLPSDAALGGYHISALDQYSYSFSVEEYVGSAFETNVEMAKGEYISGDRAEIDVSGKYYFGVPVSGGTVEYSFTAQNYYFDRYTDEYFNFGSGWYGCYDCGYGDSYIKSGQAVLDANGKGRITEVLDFDTLFGESDRDRSKIVVFHTTITDGQGKSVSAQKSFIVHRGDFYLGVKADPSFVGINQPFALRLKTVDTVGMPVRESDIEIVVNKVEWKSFKRQEVDGNYYNRTERVLTPVLTKKVNTDGKGDYSDTFKLESPGEYEISVTAKDSKDNTIKATGYLYVYGQGSVSVRSTNNATLDITADRTDLGVGDKAKIIFQSPYNYAKALITLERGRIFDYRVVDVTQSVYGYEFPIESRFTPNVYASVLLLSPEPEVKFGQVQFSVDRKEKGLNITVATDKPSYLPGEKVNLKITTADVSGKRVPAEVSVAVADLSVLALKGNPKKDPLVFFYNGFPLTITTATNIKNILTEAEIPTGTKGGGGGDPADLAKKQRGEFKDTAFWNAEVETNINGEAVVSFTLPDNLTSWQIESLGVTEDSKVGVKYQEITAQKKIMVVPLRPRFVVPGDEFEIGAQIFNQTERIQNLLVSYDSSTLPITRGSSSENKVLKPGESATVYWSVKAPESDKSGTHAFVLSAKNSEFEDTVRNEIPINSNITYEAVATANSTEDKVSKEYIFVPDGVLMDRGGLTVKTSATLAVFLSDALRYLVQFPYGCSEQLASKLSSIAIVKKGLAIPNVGDKFNLPPVQFDGNTYTIDDVVAIGLRKIYDTQTSDGGFSYYRGLPSDMYLTFSIVNALEDLKEAGYGVDNRVLESATSYIGRTLLSKGAKNFGIDSFIFGAYAILCAGGDSSLDEISAVILSLANNSFVNEKASSMTLGYLALLSVRDSRFASLSERVFNSLENRVDIDSRGAYVPSDGSNIIWQYYETPVKNTALFLKALAVGERDYSQTDKLLRWLLASRSKDGAWGSTQNTVSVIDAFTKYLSWKKETNSDFELKLSLDDTQKKSFDFNKNTVLSIFETFLPISDFKVDVMHTLSFEKENRNDLPNGFYYDIGLKYYLPAEQISPRDEGITIERNLYTLLDTKEESPVIETKVGEVLRGKITVITGKPRHLFAVEDFIPAGFELVNFNLATEDRALLESGGVGSEDKIEVFATQGNKPFGLSDYLLHPVKSLAASGVTKTVDLYDSRSPFKNELYPDFQELHDDRLFLFKQELPAGEYTFEYYLRATTPGIFRYLPAVASELYFPENFGRTGGSLFRVNR